MKVYKATRADMSCTMGQGVFTYEIGEPAVADQSKCGNTGLHACEYILDCTRYYGLGAGNRFFLAEAKGDIAEDGVNTRISCTELTLQRELDNRTIAGHAMLYMARHPRRENWQAKRHMLDVASDEAEAVLPDSVAIARGRRPKVKGVEGSHIGLMTEQDGSIRWARLFTVGRSGIKPGVWYTLADGRPEEVADDEAESN